MSNSSPSINPADNGSLAGTLQFFIKKMLQNTDGLMPAQVIAYDRTTNRVQVQLLITIVTTSGTQVPRPQIASLPVFVYGGGGFTLSFPLNTGDIGWVFANDRDISLFLQSYSQSPPNTARMKNFSDGVFIPDIMRTYNIDSDNEGYAILQSSDGTMSISMGVNKTTNAHEINILAERVLIDLGSPLAVLGVNGSIVSTGVMTPSTLIPPYPP